VAELSHLKEPETFPIVDPQSSMELNETVDGRPNLNYRLGTQFLSLLDRLRFRSHKSGCVLSAIRFVFAAQQNILPVLNLPLKGQLSLPAGFFLPDLLGEQLVIGPENGKEPA